MITQRQLAERLGLTQSAVSLALRGDASIPAATRRRVEALAAELGYRRDALVAGLAMHRWARPVGGIAYLGCQVSGGDPTTDNYWRAVRARCRTLGLPVTLIPPGRRSDAGLGAELERNGVRGLVVGQDNLDGGPWRLDWARFAVVHCGLYVAPEAGDVVAADLFAAVASAWRAMRARGYHRIAAILTARPQALSEQMLAAALLALERSVDDPRSLAVRIAAAGDRRLHAWLRSRRPDAVLGYGDSMREELQRAGITAPYAALACGEERGAAAGVSVPYTAIVAHALDVLVDKLRHGAFGQAAGRRSIHLVEMPWQDGDSLPDRSSRDDRRPSARAAGPLRRAPQGRA